MSSNKKSMSKKSALLSIAAAIILMPAVKSAATEPPKVFGKMPDGRPVHLYTLQNKKGLRVQVSDLGATLVSVAVPDRDGRSGDVVLGFDSAEGYLSERNPYFGATVGRFGNRIANGKFHLGGREYQLDNNNDPGGIPCHLHGGKTGFHTRLWALEKSTPGAVTFKYVSADGEEGYPGKLTVFVTYKLKNSGELIWEAKATTDAPTIVNIVHHPYWNLSADSTRPITGHSLVMPASHYLPTNRGLIPSGEKASVAGTPMDFRAAKAIGAQIRSKFRALAFAGGYDHCWVLDHPQSKGQALVARLHDPVSGRLLEVFSNQPAVQFYSGNFLDGSFKGKDGKPCRYRTGLCLESENFPDAPNHADFPGAVLEPGEVYRHRMTYKFSAE